MKKIIFLLVILFLVTVGVFAETETRLKEHAKDCNGIIIKTDIEKIKPGMHSKNAKLVFFAIEENESKNQEVAISIINNFKRKC